MKLKTAFLLLVCILFGFAAAAPVHAFEMREGNEIKDVTLPKDTITQGSLFAGANTVNIDGTVNGDLYCGAQTVVIRGIVNGDVICAAQTITIAGVVTGSVRTVSQILEITGTVKRNVTSAVQTVTVDSTAAISGELMAAGQTVNLNSTIGGDVNAAAQSVLLGQNAKIAGSFTYTSPNAVEEATGAAIVGKVSHILPKKQETKPFTSRNWLPARKPWPANAVAPIIFYLIVGALVVLIAREKIGRITSQMLARPWFDGLVGFLTMIGAPIAIMMVAITIIGIPIALILVVVFVLMIVLAHVYVFVIVGDKLLSALGRTKSGLLLQVIIGVIIIELLVKIPVLGFFVSAIATLWGLGGIVMSFGKRKAVK